MTEFHQSPQKTDDAAKNQSSHGVSMFFKALAWFYPILFLVLVGLSYKWIIAIIGSIGQVFSFKVALAPTMFISITLFFLLTVVLFVLKFSWFRKNVWFLIFFWIVSFMPLTGTTQGAISAAVSKAFNSEESARQVINGQ